MTGDVEKSKLKEIQAILENAKGKSIEEKKKIISDSITKIDVAIGTVTDSNKKKELEKIKAAAEKAQALAAEKEKIDNQQNAATSAALANVKNDLSGAYSQVQTSGEKQMLSIMQSTMSKMASNPSYNSGSDQASVKAIYSTLDAQSKIRFKSALATNVNSNNISVLRQVFGL